MERYDTFVDTLLIWISVTTLDLLVKNKIYTILY